MICLSSGAVLRGVASAIGVDYSICGLVNSQFANLAEGQLPTAAYSIIYASGGDNVSIVSVMMVNTSSSDVTINLYMDIQGGSPRRILPVDLEIKTGYALHFDGVSLTIVDASGAPVIADTSSSAVSDDAYDESTWDGVTTIAPSKNAVRDVLETKANAPGTKSELTISAGVVTVSGNSIIRFHSIDTEGDAATDDLDTVSGGNEGELLILAVENSARVVTCKDGVGLKLQADFILNNEEDKLLLICISAGVWHEIGRASNG